LKKTKEIVYVQDDEPSSSYYDTREHYWNRLLSFLTKVATAVMLCGVGGILKLGVTYATLITFCAPWLFFGWVAYLLLRKPL
jgi:hypothetical protein